ncbi:MAG: hypothetical protein U9O18_00045 [Chloroflexota bacterium]|nr:hypothetical protein [Chloroflexota bacterium]
MSARDRTVTLILVSAAITAWFVVAIVFTMISPVGNAGVQLLGALALGFAVGLTLWPLLWSASRSHPSAIITSGRRSGLAGLLVTILVVLRAIEVVTAPVLLFLVAGAVLVEVAFTLRR